MLITRIIELTIFPPGIFILLGLTGLWLTRRHRRAGNLLLVLTFSMLWLVSTPWFSYRLLNSLQDQYPDLSDIPANADSIVVLSGGTVASDNAYKPADASFERLHTAAMLGKQSELPVIITGGKLWGARQSEAALMAEVLKKDFAFSIQVILEEKSKTTWEHPVNIKPLLKEYGFKKPIVVTHAWHMPRTIFSFQQHGLNVIAGPAHRSEPLLIEKSFVQYLPNASSIERTRIALHEWLGLLVYKYKEAS